MASINAKLDDAINRGNLEEVKELLRQGADIEYQDPFGSTPLMNAAWIASTELVDYLISKGANVNHLDKEGESALSRVKSIGHNEFGHNDVIDLLVSKGAK